LPLIDPETGQPSGETSLIIGPLKVGGPPVGATVAQATPQLEVDTLLGEQIKLLGVDVGPQAELNLTFYWEPVTTVPINYTLFIHVRDETGETVAQKDNPPLNGAYPTSLWEVGEIIKDEVQVPIDQLKPGRYELVVGLYDFATGQRLKVAGSPDDTIWLQSFEVRAK
jgi:hypothetical protein